MSQHLAKTILGAAVARLPWGARKTLFDALLTHMDGSEGSEAVGRFIKRLGLTGLLAEGDCGLIEAPSDSNFGDFIHTLLFEH